MDTKNKKKQPYKINFLYGFSILQRQKKEL